MKTPRTVLLAVLVAVAYLVTGLSAPCNVEAYFVSPSVDRVIEQQVIHALSGAQSEVLIAMYSFTDDEIGSAVLDAYARGVDVRILLDDGQDSSAQGREWPKLMAAGIPTAVEHESGLLHDKFVVIDGVTVITGSYNWTDSADKRNFENIVILRCFNVAQEYRDEFFRK